MDYEECETLVYIMSIHFRNKNEFIPEYNIKNLCYLRPDLNVKQIKTLIDLIYIELVEDIDKKMSTHKDLRTDNPIIKMMIIDKIHEKIETDKKTFIKEIINEYYSNWLVLDYSYTYFPM